MASSLATGKFVHSNYSAYDTLYAFLIEAGIRNNVHTLHKTVDQKIISEVFFKTFEGTEPNVVKEYISGDILIELGLDFSSFESTQKVEVSGFKKKYGQEAVDLALRKYEERVRHVFIDAAYKERLD